MDELDGWVTILQDCAGTIVGVELAHPKLHELKVAARPFLDYVAGLGEPVGEPALD